jgi:calcium/calmodulin-dependent protein kinase I
VNKFFGRPAESTENADSKLNSSFGDRLSWQPPSYRKKGQYIFGKTVGAGTYGIVREAEINGDRVAVKIILKKNLKGKEHVIWNELNILQPLEHPNIVKLRDWFESNVSWRICCEIKGKANTEKDKYYVCMQLGTGGELFDRICDKGRFTEREARNTIQQVLEAVNYLHQRDIIHRGARCSDYGPLYH